VKRQMLQHIVMMIISIAKGCFSFLLTCLVAHSGFSQVGTSTPIRFQHVLAKEKERYVAQHLLLPRNYNFSVLLMAAAFLVWGLPHLGAASGTYVLRAFAGSEVSMHAADGGRQCELDIVGRRPRLDRVASFTRRDVAGDAGTKLEVPGAGGPDLIHHPA
jgi:hypothetical protein